MATTFDVLLDSYRDLADSERMKGNYLEQLVGRYLEKDAVQAPQYRNAWLWRDWPDRDGKKDLGIDVVAERQDGGFTAIQCKFHAEGHRIQKHDIDSFISASGKPPFTHRLIVDTTGRDWRAKRAWRLTLGSAGHGLSDGRFIATNFHSPG